MTLHIFNPEHDIALASGLANFTAPHAGRQLRHDLGWLPALWAAGDDDVILVDDVEKSMRAARRRKAGLTRFVTRRQLATLAIDHIEPWGWDAALCAQLLRAGVDGRLMPSAEQLETIRQLSHRRTAATLLPFLRMEGTVGESFECGAEGQVQTLMERYGQVVLKAPWSSSGRGIRFVGITLDEQNVRGWLRNTLTRQGSVMVEPFYYKVKDFGMEFLSDGHGVVSYLGLSLFHTENGAYTGNLLATEKAKREMLGHYLPLDLLDAVQQNLCTLLGERLGGQYSGPLGIDMMICLSQGRLLLHPCVEMNLRRTMGHAALALSPDDDDIRHVMRFEYALNNYKLCIKRL